MPRDLSHTFQYPVRVEWVLNMSSGSSSFIEETHCAQI
jgi:hypothetical protein